MPYYQFSQLDTRVLFILEDAGHRVIENCGRFIEANAMFDEV